MYEHKPGITAKKLVKELTAKHSIEYVSTHSLYNFEDSCIENLLPYEDSLIEIIVVFLQFTRNLTKSCYLRTP